MRLLTPAIKYWVCKSAPGFLYEAMECLGGNGYVEEGILARHYRESPVNAIWEGSGNVMCLDVLRALSREAEAAIGGVARTRRRRPRACRARARRWHSSARRSAGRTASASRGWRSRSWRCWRPRPRSTRCRRVMRELFAATRLAGNHASMYGAVDLANDDISGLLERALPSKVVMAGLKREARLRADVPGIHVLRARRQERRGWPGQARP